MADIDHVSKADNPQPERGSWLAGAASAVYHALFRDGALGRAGTQGLDELGQALIAMPGAIHASERGAVPWNPSESRSEPLVGVWAEQPSAFTDTASLYGHDAAAESTVHGRSEPAVGVWAEANRDETARPMQMAENPKNWVEKELEREQNRTGDSDQNELAKGRVLPIEQKEQREREDNGRGR